MANKLQLLNAIGNIVPIFYQKSGTNIQIAINHLPIGIYLLQILTEDNALEEVKTLLENEMKSIINS